jgi:cell division protein FtsQ
MDAEAFPQEVLAEEEPKYLRRQKPLEIKRRKFGRKAWRTYARVTLWVVVGLGASFLAYSAWHFLYAAPEMALLHPDQISVHAADGSTLRFVQRNRILEVFAPDRGHSVLRVPLDERRRELEAIPWVEEATVRRALPNNLQIEIVERTPVAFLRQGSDMALVDVHGVILDRPVEGDFDFPVVTGVSAAMEPDDRARRMQLFASFLQQAESAHTGASRQISEVDLSDSNDLRALISGLQSGDTAGFASATSSGSAASAQSDAPLLVHFGDGDFQTKYANLIENIGKWRAAAGRLESLDLRFKDEAVGNPDTSATKTQQAIVAQPQHAPQHASAAPHVASVSHASAAAHPAKKNSASQASKRPR